MLNKISDTIVAIATGSEKSGIGIIRLSGKLAYNIGFKVIKKKINPRFATYVKFFDKNNVLIDFGLAIFFKGPNSYTGEDILEFHSHGNKFILNHLVFRLIELGARLAESGEFTFRAFINKKLDLLQAESINQLINANSLYLTKNILKSLGGNFSKKINYMLDLLLDLRKDIEASIDFPEFVDFDKKNSFKKFLILESYFLKLMDNISSINYSLDVIKTVIVGAPNVGKSSLFNLIIGEERSIVSNIPGTTRDYVDRNIDINNIVFNLVDTAGLNLNTIDVIEQTGIKKSIEQLREASLVIYIVDFNNKSSEKDFFLDDILNNYSNIKKVFLIKNKIDLFECKPKIIENKYFTEVYMSVLTKEGFNLFFDSFKNFAFSFGSDSYVLCNRNFDLLIKFKDYMNKSKKLFDYDQIDLLADNFRCMHLCLSNILGRDFNEDLISEIFSNFCLGK